MPTVHPPIAETVLSAMPSFPTICMSTSGNGQRITSCSGAPGDGSARLSRTSSSGVLRGSSLLDSAGSLRSADRFGEPRPAGTTTPDFVWSRIYETNGLIFTSCFCSAIAKRGRLNSRRVSWWLRSGNPCLFSVGCSS